MRNITITFQKLISSKIVSRRTIIKLQKMRPRQNQKHKYSKTPSNNENVHPQNFKH